MKAAVITLHHVCNYGTQLQAFATQEKLKQYFDEVVFIDYRRQDTYGLGLMHTFTKGNPIKIPIIVPTLIYWRHLFGGFRKKHLNLTSKSYTKNEDFNDFEDCADVYFTGSDQIWNAEWNHGIVPAFFLNFVMDIKPKFAFSSSFGKDRVTDAEVVESKKYINRFQRISVREESGVEILKEQYKYEQAVRVVDPTLCMPPSFWRKIAPPSRIDRDYILIYNLSRSREFDEYAAELSRRTGVHLYRLCTRFDQLFRNGKSIIMPDILDFVTLIDNARYVLTDSFHATAFSMNLNTEPLCVYPDKYSGRISEFLDLLDSKQRHVLDFSDFDIIKRHVDFAYVNKVLENERQNADNFFTDIFYSLNQRDSKNKQ